MLGYGKKYQYKKLIELFWIDSRMFQGRSENSVVIMVYQGYWQERGQDSLYQPE